MLLIRSLKFDFFKFIWEDGYKVLVIQGVKAQKLIFS